MHFTFQRVRWVVVLICVGSLAACFSPQFSDNPVCGPGGECPDGTKCLRNACVDNACDGKPDGAVCANATTEDGVCLGAQCLAVGCGDGTIASGEQCDNGLTNSDTVKDACRTNCTVARCGDHVVDSGETCDDGNLVSGDGCSADCLSAEVCGNGIVDASFADASKNEQCDEGVPGLSGDGCSSKCQNESIDWRESSPPTLLGFNNSPIAYDTHRHRVVLFDGVERKTWEFDSGVWIQRHPRTMPTNRTDFSMTFDAVRNRTILFGGKGETVTAQLLNDTWEYDGVEWRELTGISGPIARISSMMVFDSRRGKTVLFGGVSGLGSSAIALSDTWEFDGSTWSQFVGAPPSYLITSTFVFDTKAGKIVMFGRGETWTFDGVAWQRIVTLTAPLERKYECSAFDPTSGHTLLFGGLNNFNGGGVYRDLWAFDGSNWQQLPTSNPLPRFGCAMFFDETRPALVMFGGRISSAYADDMWQFSGTTWKQITTRLEVLNGGKTFALVFDENQKKVVGYRADDKSVAMWEFDGSNWRQQQLSVVPSPRDDNLLGFDSSRKRLVLYGGSRFVNGIGTVPLNDTWEFDGSQWNIVSTAHSPPPLLSSSLTFDENLNTIVLFGGQSSRGIDSNETWDFNGKTWTRLVTLHSPPARHDHSMAFDSLRNRLVIFGGFSEGVAVADLWEFDGVDWTEVSTGAHSPPAGQNSVMQYDRRLRRITMLGFDTAPFPRVKETWEFDGISWSNPVSAAPLGQTAIGMAFDEHRSEMVLTQGGADRKEIRVWTRNYSLPTNPPDDCHSWDLDSDSDGYFGCGDSTHPPDPDCWERCTPECGPSTTASDLVTMSTVAWPASCAIAYPAAPRCGDGNCNLNVEDKYLCPIDCL
jgi:cysteine-rich repeat protein